jgi:hypothetical protein
MARVIRRGEKLGAFVDDSLLDVEVDQMTRIIKGRRAIEEQPLPGKSFGERMFPRLSVAGLEEESMADEVETAGAAGASPTPARDPRERYEDVTVRKAAKKAAMVQAAALLGDELAVAAPDTVPTAAVASAGRRKSVTSAAEESQPWLHGPITREDAEALLTKAARIDPRAADGLYLVRLSAKKAAGYVISLFFAGTCHHYIFKEAGSGFVLKGKFFDAATVRALLEQFKEDDDVGLACVLRRYVRADGSLEPAEHSVV